MFFGPVHSNFTIPPPSNCHNSMQSAQLFAEHAEARSRSRSTVGVHNQENGLLPSSSTSNQGLNCPNLPKSYKLMDADAACFTVLCYNVLAVKYARTDWLPHTTSKILDTNYRHPNLIKEILYPSAADILCLQVCTKRPNSFSSTFFRWSTDG